MEIKVKIIEKIRNAVLELTELLPKTLIICGTIADESVLLSENLENMGAFISVTGRDEENIIAALLAKQYVKAISKVNRAAYSIVIDKMDIDNVVIPKQITANTY